MTIAVAILSVPPWWWFLALAVPVWLFAVKPVVDEMKERSAERDEHLRLRGIDPDEHHYHPLRHPVRFVRAWRQLRESERRARGSD